MDRKCSYDGGIHGSTDGMQKRAARVGGNECDRLGREGVAEMGAMDGTNGIDGWNDIKRWVGCIGGMQGIDRMDW